MKFRSFYLVFSIIFIIFKPFCSAMDIESELLRMPPEVLTLILQFVFKEDPNALGNLVKIQQVCKKLADVLPKDQVLWILKLNQTDLNDLLDKEMKPKDSENFHSYNPEKIRLLFNFGAQLNEYNTDNAISTVLRNAEFFLYANNREQFLKDNILTTMFEVIKLLKQHGATYPQSTSTSILVSKLTLTFPEVATFLITHGVKPEGGDLHLAVINENIQFVKLFLEHGAQPAPWIFWRAVDSDRDLEIIKLLIKHGADVNATDSKMPRPLPPLAYAKTPETAKILLQAGAHLFINCTEAPISALIKLKGTHRF